MPYGQPAFQHLAPAYASGGPAPTYYGPPLIQRAPGYWNAPVGGCITHASSYTPSYAYPPNYAGYATPALSYQPLALPTYGYVIGEDLSDDDISTDSSDDPDDASFDFEPLQTERQIGSVKQEVLAARPIQDLPSSPIESKSARTRKLIKREVREHGRDSVLDKSPPRVVKQEVFDTSASDRIVKVEHEEQDHATLDMTCPRAVKLEGSGHSDENFKVKVEEGDGYVDQTPGSKAVKAARSWW